MEGNRTHLSDIQDICTGPLDQDTNELVLGEVYGLREWAACAVTDYYGPMTQHPSSDILLVGHFGATWDPTRRHVGTCRAGGVYSEIEIRFFNTDLDGEDIERRLRQHIDQWLTDEIVPARRIDLSAAKILITLSDSQTSRQAVVYATWMIDEPFSGSHRIYVPDAMVSSLRAGYDISAQIRIAGKKTKHEVGHPACVCGIYAYHNRESLPRGPRETGYGSVFGLVKGYGYVTVGTKGFRAEMAEVVALTLPTRDQVPDSVLSRALEEWRSAGITTLPDLQSLLEFADRGGYLERFDQ